MVELAFTHLGYFFKSGFREAHFFVFWLVFFLFFFFCPGAAVFVLKLAFVAFPCSKWCFNKALIGHLQFVL